MHKAFNGISYKYKVSTHSFELETTASFVPSGSEPVKEREKPSAIYCPHTHATHFNVYING